MISRVRFEQWRPQFVLPHAISRFLPHNPWHYDPATEEDFDGEYMAGVYCTCESESGITLGFGSKLRDRLAFVEIERKSDPESLADACSVLDRLELNVNVRDPVRDLSDFEEGLGQFESLENPNTGGVSIVAFIDWAAVIVLISDERLIRLITVLNQEVVVGNSLDEDFDFKRICQSFVQPRTERDTSTEESTPFDIILTHVIPDLLAGGELADLLPKHGITMADYEEALKQDRETIDGLARESAKLNQQRPRYQELKQRGVF